ncbi:TPA: phage shock protein PspD [Proteus mirabilis]|uniref:Peptide permease n=3 Tax=Proteus mirabilis TaxID=584 RepID=A0AAJ4RG81_PROMI|nr:MULTISPECIES: phage shock protein PspD [Enterobacterales]EDK4124421.1 peptide permease [Salmonella enterica]EEI49158.1 putative phage shock protein PspD [Proteus mirabilis ATCC 29906]MBA7796030.1 phage shock protein PspD [Citrobacter sp. RHBSTW-01065]NBL81568.1 phage shock protein PspD [Proteus sp. G2674]NBL92138.1 phage shock protein PspD [Proteus sp. G2675]NBM28721.1 phage shock protein PspD [Proteus sp. G4417]NBM36445.1 phage shock protein PspD [Proteus sp. G4419]NBM60684.1 phage shoc
MMNSTLIPTTVKTNKLTKWAKKGVTFALMLLTLFGPAAITGGILKRVSYKPLRWLVLLIAEPMIKMGLDKLSRHVSWEKHETLTK